MRSPERLTPGPRGFVVSGLNIPVPKKHWSTRYMRDRLRLSLWQRRHPDSPWLVAEAVHFLGEWLRSSDSVVEFGSGRSTAWFAARAGLVVSVEHDPQWHAIVTERLRSRGLSNVRYNLVPEKRDTSRPSVDDYLENPHRYLEAAERDLNGPVDLILNDGMLRDLCALWSLAHVRPGGLVVVDNANRYLPHATRSPASIAPGDPPRSKEWGEFLERTRSWRRVWFSNGVTDTAVFFVPAGPG